MCKRKWKLHLLWILISDFQSHVFCEFEGSLASFFNFIWPKLFMQILNETLYLITMACLQKRVYDKRYYKSQSLTMSYNQPIESGC